MSDLWQKVEFCMQACEYGVVVYETIGKRDFNPNVSIKLAKDGRRSGND